MMREQIHAVHARSRSVDGIGLDPFHLSDPQSVGLGRRLEYAALGDGPHWQPNCRMSQPAMPALQRLR
jgi:hypothetical protein